MADRALTLEEAFEQLEQVTAKLEEADLSLEDSFRFYQQGMELVRHCNEQIDKVEKKVLVLNGEGQLDEF